MYSVSILFDDGSYHANVQADNETHAYNMALIDARMGSEFGSHFGRVVKQTTKEVKDGCNDEH